MHNFINVEKGDLSYTVLICKGSCLEGCKAIEKYVWDIRVPVIFQKNVWVDTDTIIDLANIFTGHIKDKHNGLHVTFVL